MAGRRRGCRPGRLASVALVLAALAGCASLDSQETRGRADFLAWAQHHHAALAPFEARLAQEGLAAEVPLHELLRSASDWSKCSASPYALAPAEQWSSVASVLGLLRSLRQAGVVDRFEIMSAHRPAALNACAGGAARSAHLVAFAVDLLFPEPAAARERLCRFWQTEGAAWRMGLGLYPSGRVHLDTHGWRTWGGDGEAIVPCRKP